MLIRTNVLLEKYKSFSLRTCTQTLMDNSREPRDVFELYFLDLRIADEVIFSNIEARELQECP